MNNDDVIYYANQCLRKLDHPRFEDKWVDIIDGEVRFYFKINIEREYNRFFAMRKIDVENEIQNGFLMNTIVAGLREIFLRVEQLDITKLEVMD